MATVLEVSQILTAGPEAAFGLDAVSAGQKPGGQVMQGRARALLLVALAQG